MDSLSQLTAFSADIGRDVNLVQAGGGNTSLKKEGVLWVKASGMWLARAADQEIFVAAPLKEVLEAVEERSDYVTPCATASGTLLKPSVETTLHAVLPQHVVVHVHSVNTIAWASQQNAPDELASRLDGFRWAWLPYVYPGVELARAIAALPRPEPDVIVMGNHGLIIAANDCGEARDLLDAVEQRLRRPPRLAGSSDTVKLQSIAVPGFRLPAEEEVHAIGTDAFSTDIAERGILFPDQCVYLGAPAVIREGTAVSASIDKVRQTFGTSPKYAIIPGAGVLVSDSLDRAGWEMLVAVKRVLERLDATATIQFLDIAEVSRLLNWDAEKYRAALATRFSQPGS